MGIRFVCPNGHPLHVKAELSGKRGVCPHCQAKFLIPAPEGSAPDVSVPGGEAPTPVTTPHPSSHPAPVSPAKTPTPVATPPPSAPASAAPSAPSPAVPAPVQGGSEAAWYIRPAAGGQFGPADEQLLRQWAGEGRIAADAYVWRTGWPDWRRAADVAQFFPHLAASSPASVSSPTDPAQQTTDPTAPATAAAERYRRRKKQAAQGQQMAAIVLVVLALALGGVLLWVLRTKGTNDQPVAIESPPAVAAPSEEEPEVDEPEQDEPEQDETEQDETEPADEAEE